MSGKSEREFEMISTWPSTEGVENNVLFHAPALRDIIIRLKPKLIVTLSKRGTPFTQMIANCLDAVGSDAEIWDFVEESVDAENNFSANVSQRSGTGTQFYGLASMSVDMLVVDQEYDVDFISQLHGYWHSRLSESGVVFLHNVSRFKDINFLQRVRKVYPSVRIKRGSGLEVIFVGHNARVVADAQESAVSNWSFYLTRLGDAHYYQAKASELDSENDRLRISEAELLKKARTADKLYVSYQSEVKRSADALAELHRIDGLFAKLSELLRKNKIVNEDVENLVGSLPSDQTLRREAIHAILNRILSSVEIEETADSYAAEIQSLRFQEQKFKSEIKTQSDDISSLLASLAVKDEEISALTDETSNLRDHFDAESSQLKSINFCLEAKLNMSQKESERQALELGLFANMSNEISSALSRVLSNVLGRKVEGASVLESISCVEREFCKIHGQIDALRSDLDRSQKSLEEERRRREDILGSTSWRILSPMRRLVMFLRGHG